MISPELESAFRKTAAERDRFKELWDGTRATAERFRVALEEIARIDFRGYPHESARIARRALYDGREGSSE